MGGCEWWQAEDAAPANEVRGKGSSPQHNSTHRVHIVYGLWMRIFMDGSVSLQIGSSSSLEEEEESPRWDKLEKFGTHLVCQGVVVGTLMDHVFSGHDIGISV